MANRLKMATIQAVLQLHAQQWSFRRIARELHIDRETVSRYVRLAEAKPAHFGGVPRTLVIDNLKAAVLHPDWFDPGLNPKLQSFAQHYGTVILPTRPRTPRHKGKVERGIDYVQENGLKGRKFASLEAENRHLLDWEAHTADTRIHGTTKRQVGPVFQAIERAALSPLPIERFPFFHEAQRKVSRDGHIEVAKAYYSLPPEYMTRTVWVRWDARLVRIFNSRFEPIAVHARHEAGRFSTHGQHLAAEKINGLERGVNYLLEKVRPIGPHSHDWAQAMIRARGIEGTRVLQGLLSLTRKHPSEMLEKACDTALSHGAFRLRTLRKLLQRAAEKQPPLPFLDEHPLIRPLDDYAQVVAESLARRVGFSRHDRAAEGRGEKQRSLEEAPPQGLRGIPPPWTGYPLSGCSPAEPDSVSPDDPSVIPPSACHQFPSPQE